MWAIRCVRSSVSMFGAASALLKDTRGRVKTFSTEDLARAYCNELNSRVVSNVSYFPEEKANGRKESTYRF